jgi:thiol-disulfide isomerase/thioredoxin
MPLSPAWILLFALAAPGPAETRVVEYLRANVRPGEPVVASRLASEVFTSPEERAALDRLFGVFFELPLYAARHQRESGRPPTLAEIAARFGLGVPGTPDVLLRIMEADPRMPRFFERDARSGEITRVDADAVQAHPRFGRGQAASLAGLVGRPAPAFTAPAFSGPAFSSQTLRGQAHVVYFWFTGCPPCAQTTPALRTAATARKLPVVALNADRVLDLGIDDAERQGHAQQMAGFTLAHATPETQAAYAVGVYPTLFFVNAQGVVVRQLAGGRPAAEIEAAADEARR